MAFVLESAVTEALLGVTLLLVVLLYRSLTSQFDYWRRRGLPYLPPQPFFGNVRDLVLQKKSSSEAMIRLYKEGAPHPVVGFFFQSTPALLIRDPEIVKSILIKDFSYFSNRFQMELMPKTPTMANLFFVESRRWRPLRTKLSPTFSSGRIKSMFPLLAECASKLQDAMTETVASGQQVVELRDALAKFSTDVIGTCAFGLQCNSIQDPESPFRTVGRKIFEPRPGIAVITSIMEAFPVLKKLRFNFRGNEVSNFFVNLVKETVKERKEKGITRNDFLQLLIQLKEKGHLDGEKSVVETEESIEFTDELMTAQCFVFFAAGFETSSTTMSFCLHELALHPDIQEKVRREIDNVLNKHGGKMTYDAIQEMSYLDQVVSETLRMYPPLGFLQRHCETPYKVPGTQFLLEPNTRVLIPVSALHTDPHYFPDPDCFDPERFNDSNKANINKGAYLPFGDGPRNCIGMRFGLLQTKVGLVALLSRFKLEVSSETTVPPQLAPLSFVTMPVGGVRLRVTPRGAGK